MPYVRLYRSRVDGKELDDTAIPLAEDGEELGRGENRREQGGTF